MLIEHTTIPGIFNKDSIEAEDNKRKYFKSIIHLNKIAAHVIFLIYHLIVHVVLFDCALAERTM